MHHNHGAVEAGLLVHPAASDPRDAKGLEALVAGRLHPQHLQAHAQEDVINREELHRVTGMVEMPSQNARHEETPSAGIGRVGGLAVHDGGDVIFVFFSADGPSMLQDIPYKQVFLGLAVRQKLEQVGRVDEDVVIPFEDEGDIGTVNVKPLKEVDLLEGQVEEAVKEVPL